MRAVLPAPIDVYRSDFKGNALKEFNQFFSQENKSSKFVYEEIPLPEEKGNRGFSNQDRNQIYVRLMDYLIRRSNIIIAVWVWSIFRAEGGTSEVIRNYLNVPVLNNFLNLKINQWSSNKQPNVYSNVIIWIPTTRIGQKIYKKQSIKYLFFRRNFR